MAKAELSPEEKARRNREKCRQWRAENIERERARKRAYMAQQRAERPEEIAATKKKWAAANPEYIRASSRRQYSKDPQRSVVRRRRWMIKKFGISRTNERILLERCHAVIPRTLPRDVRDDVYGMLILSVYEGRTPLRVRPEHAKAILAEHYRHFSKFDTVSLDAVVSENGATRGQLLGFW